VRATRIRCVPTGLFCSHQMFHDAGLHDIRVYTLFVTSDEMFLLVSSLLRGFSPRARGMCEEAPRPLSHMVSLEGGCVHSHRSFAIICRRSPHCATKHFHSVPGKSRRFSTAVYLRALYIAHSTMVHLAPSGLLITRDRREVATHARQVQPHSARGVPTSLGDITPFYIGHNPMSASDTQTAHASLEQLHWRFEDVLQSQTHPYRGDGHCWTQCLRNHASWLNYHDGVDLHRCHFGLLSRL
jgi:hypothetical protein